MLEEIQGKNFDENPGGDLGEILGRKSRREYKKISMEIVLGISPRGDLITISWQESCPNLVSGSQDLVQSFFRNLT